MKIGIDARFVGPQGTGLGKYSEKLILNLQEIDKKNSYYIFLKKSNWNYLNLSGNFQKVEADVNWYSIQEQLKLASIFNKADLDLLHVPHFNAPILYRKKLIVTIHDLIHHQFSQESSTTKNLLVFKFKRVAYKFIIENAIKKSVKILVPSSYVREQIFKNFDIDHRKIIVTHEAAEEEYVNDSNTMNHEPTTHNLIYVGNAYPHKNLNALLDAVQILVNNKEFIVQSIEKFSNHEPLTHNLKLTIVCPRDVFTNRLNQQIQAKSLTQHIEIKPYQEPKELSELFSKSSAYVFPSLSEGFGIPGLNAMAANLPVIAADIPTLKEVYGDAAMYFDPKNPADMADKITKVLKDKKTRTNLVAKGQKQVKKYSWQKMAEETLKVYESV